MEPKTSKMVARAIILKRKQKITYVLVVKKQSEPETFELPGGQRKKSEKWVTALIRELFEELNIHIVPTAQHPMLFFLTKT